MAVNSFNAQNPPVNTKGDLFTFSTIPTKLGVGTNGQVLQADSTAATGLKWATASSGGMTLITTSTPSAATSLSFTSIPGTYKHLLLIWTGVYQSVSSNSAWWQVQLNQNSSGLCNFQGTGLTSGALTSGITTYNSNFGDANWNAPIPQTDISSGAGRASGFFWIYNYAGSTIKTVNYGSTGQNGSNYSGCGPIFINGYFDSTSAITRIDFIRNSTQTMTGTFLLYGVS